MVDPVSRSPAIPTPGSQQRGQASEIRAAALTMPEAIQRAPGSWLEATVTSRASDGSYGLRTHLGSMGARVPDGILLRLGANIMVKVDGHGNLLVRVPGQPFDAHLAAAPRSSLVPPSERPPPSTFLVSELPPVRGPLFVSEAPQSQAASSVLGLLPQVGSGAFALAAALYPQLLRTGELSRLLRQTRGTSSVRNASSLLERIESIASAPAPRMDKSQGWMGWQLPFWDGHEINKSAWLFKGEVPQQDDEPTEDHQAVVQLELRNLGPIQIHCFASENSWLFRFVSISELPATLQGEISSILAFFAEVFSISVSYEFQLGNEHFLTVTTV